MRSATLVLLLALMVPMAAAALPLPEPVVREFPDLRLAGEGRLRWLGLHIYDAALWVNGRQWDPERGFALDIVYARALSGKRLAGTSIDEMRRLGYGDESSHARWGEQLARLFPDVRKGERITGVNRPGMGAEFYHQGRFIGRIAEPEFARAFFAIWLDERTREPKLRESLFGAR